MLFYLPPVVILQVYCLCTALDSSGNKLPQAATLNAEYGMHRLNLAHTNTEFPPVVYSNPSTKIQCFWGVPVLKFSSDVLEFTAGVELNFDTFVLRYYCLDQAH